LQIFAFATDCNKPSCKYPRRQPQKTVQEYNADGFRLDFLWFRALRRLAKRGNCSTFVEPRYCHGLARLLGFPCPPLRSCEGARDNQRHGDLRSEYSLFSRVLRRGGTVLKLLAMIADAMGSRLLRVGTHAAIAFCIDSGIYLSNKKPHLHTLSHGMSPE